MSQYVQLQHFFGDHEDLYISASLFYFSFVINNAKPHWNITLNILIYELDMIYIYIFDTNIVCPYEMREFIWFLIDKRQQYVIFTYA